MGNISPGFFRKILNQIYPFTLRNVIVEYPSMKLPIVDVSQIPEQTQYSNLSPKRKLLFHIKYASSFTATKLLTITKSALALRNHFFDESKKPDTTHEVFKKGFQDII